MRSTLFTISILLQLIPALLPGQKKMLIQQIAGKQIVRENFDRNGKLKDKQHFVIGELKQQGQVYQVEVITELYNQEGEPGKKYTTTYTCKPNEPDVLLNVFPFTNPKKEKIKVAVNSGDFKELYNLNDLKEMRLELTFESGLLNFFGSRNNIRIYNRNLTGNSGSNIINSSLKMEAYVLGLKVKTIYYQLRETLNEAGTLTYQEFQSQNGSYFTMRYQ